MYLYIDISLSLYIYILYYIVYIEPPFKANLLLGEPPSRGLLYGIRLTLRSGCSTDGSVIPSWG